MISAGGDGRLRCWNVLAMRPLFVLPLTPPIARDPLQRPPRPAAGLGIGRDAITALRWERRLGMLLAGDAAGRVAVWDGSALVRLLASASTAPLRDEEVLRQRVGLGVGSGVLGGLRPSECSPSTYSHSRQSAEEEGPRPLPLLPGDHTSRSTPASSPCVDGARMRPPW